MSIGIMVGDDPWSLREVADLPNPVVTAADVPGVDGAFVADPFAVHRDGVWYLFFEVMNRGLGKGQIACARSRDLRTWDHLGVVLDEPYHLSYPSLVEVDGAVYMVPECWESRQVRLYRATDLPGGWQYEGALVRGLEGLDPTVHRDGDRWHLLVCTSVTERYDTLRWFTAGRLQGPWTEHPDSPLVDGDPSSARPGGRVFVHDGRAHRLGQDCARQYGERLRAFPLADPGAAGRDVLVAEGAGWRGAGMHHADIHAGSGTGPRYVAFVDGQAPPE